MIPGIRRRASGRSQAASGACLKPVVNSPPNLHRSNVKDATEPVGFSRQPIIRISNEVVPLHEVVALLYTPKSSIAAHDRRIIPLLRAGEVPLLAGPPLFSAERCRRGQRFQGPTTADARAASPATGAAHTRSTQQLETHRRVQGRVATAAPTRRPVANARLPRPSFIGPLIFGRRAGRMVKMQRYEPSPCLPSGFWSKISDEPPRGHLRGRFNARSRTAASLSPRQNSQRPSSTELSRSKPQHGESRRRTWRIRIENRPKRVPHAHRLGAMSGTPEHFLKLSSDKESSPYPCMISQLRDLPPYGQKNEPARLNLSRVRTNFNWRP